MPPIVEERQVVAPDVPVVARKPFLVEQAVFVGGLPGCGKTMMTPIVGTFARVEIQKFDWPIEYLCTLYLLGKLEPDAAITMIRMLTDLDLYNLAMSREVNMRLSDLSSVFRNAGTWRYLRRLIQPGDAAAVERIRRERPILHITFHNALAISPLLFEALGDRLRLLEIVRHPLYMIKQWYAYIDRYGRDERDFGICLAYQGRSVPFFARGWEERYLCSNAMDRVIYSIQTLSQMGEQVLRDLPEAQQAQVMVVPFEPFVLNPWPHLTRLEAFLGTTMTPATRRELKRQHVPRGMIAKGIARSIYRQCGWQPPDAGSSERQELEKRRQFAAAEATTEGMAVLDRLCAEYEATYFQGALR